MYSGTACKIGEMNVLGEMNILGEKIKIRNRNVSY